MDKDTAKVLTEQEEIALGVRGTFWSIVKARFITRIMELGDILAIEEKDPQKLILEVGARQEAVKILLELIRDIEGDAIRHKTNQDIYKEEREILILRK